MTKDDEFEHREKILIGFLEKFAYSDSDNTNKITGFSPQNSSLSVMFQSKSIIEEVELVVAEKYKFENRANQKKAALLGNFGLLRH